MKPINRGTKWMSFLLALAVGVAAAYAADDQALDPAPGVPPPPVSTRDPDPDQVAAMQAWLDEETAVVTLSRANYRVKNHMLVAGVSIGGAGLVVLEIDWTIEDLALFGDSPRINAEISPAALSVLGKMEGPGTSPVPVPSSEMARFLVDPSSATICGLFRRLIGDVTFTLPDGSRVTEATGLNFVNVVSEAGLTEAEPGAEPGPAQTSFDWFPDDCPAGPPCYTPTGKQLTCAEYRGIVILPGYCVECESYFFEKRYCDCIDC